MRCICEILSVVIAHLKGLSTKLIKTVVFFLSRFELRSIANISHFNGYYYYAVFAVQKGENKLNNCFI